MSAVTSHREMQDLISAGQLDQLFRRHLGWDNPRQEPLPLGLDVSMAAHPVASKKVVDVWRVPCPAGASRGVVGFGVEPRWLVAGCELGCGDGIALGAEGGHGVL